MVVTTKLLGVAASSEPGFVAGGPTISIFFKLEDPFRLDRFGSWRERSQGEGGPRTSVGQDLQLRLDSAFPVDTIGSGDRMMEGGGVWEVRHKSTHTRGLIIVPVGLGSGVERKGGKG